MRTYLLETEREKRAHGVARKDGQLLTARYQQEIDQPAIAYAECLVLLAEIAAEPAGVVILGGTQDAPEIKRLWAAPYARGRGVGRSLLSAALREAGVPVRLSVWEWRKSAITLYESMGFSRVPSWDPRPRLICMIGPDLSVHPPGQSQSPPL